MVCGVAPSPRPLSRDCTVTMVTQWQHDARASCSQSLSNWLFKKSPDAPHLLGGILAQKPPETLNSQVILVHNVHANVEPKPLATFVFLNEPDVLIKYRRAPLADQKISAQQGVHQLHMLPLQVHTSNTRKNYW